MNLVNKVEQLTNEANLKAITSIDMVKEGDQVMFKKGTAYAGMAGFIVNKHADSVDLKFGKATRMEVPLSDLMLIDNNGNIK